MRFLGTIVALTGLSNRERKGTMSRFSHNRRALLALATVVAIIAVVYPTCRMIGCSAPATGFGGAMSMSGGSGFGAPLGDLPRMVKDCGGEFISSVAPIGVMPSGIESLLLALSAALVGGIVLFAPHVTMRPVLIAYAEPPPPPQDPRGERFRI